MTLLQLLPPMAYVLAAATILAAASGRTGTADWRRVAGLAALFAAFTAATLLEDGVTGFWRNHTTSLSGNQVWFDLVIAVALAFVLIAPRARAAGMALVPWGVAVALTACVALLAMYARLLWLDAREARGTGAAPSGGSRPAA